MTQLHLFYPPKINVDGRVDMDGKVTYIGDAHYSHGDGFYKCLAGGLTGESRRPQKRLGDPGPFRFAPFTTPSFSL